MWVCFNFLNVRSVSYLHKMQENSYLIKTSAAFFFQMGSCVSDSSEDVNVIKDEALLRGMPDERVAEPSVISSNSRLATRAESSEASAESNIKQFFRSPVEMLSKPDINTKTVNCVNRLRNLTRQFYKRRESKGSKKRESEEDATEEKEQQAQEMPVSQGDGLLAGIDPKCLKKFSKEVSDK